jgi:hypothetical protein
MRFPGEPDNALHVIEPFSVPEWWPRILSIDWGKTALCYAMWGAISPDKRIYVYRERYWRGRDIAHWASEIKEIHDALNETPTYTVLCGSAWHQRGGETIASDFTKYSGLVASSSENTPGSRVATLQIVHDFLRWEQKRLIRSKQDFYDLAAAQRIYRLYGQIALVRYRRQFIDEPEETNIPVLQIFNTCKLLIDTIPMAVYDEKKTEDVAEFEGDDPLDDLRYFCKACRQFLNGEITGFEDQMKVNLVVESFQKHQDVNKHYNEMRVLEHGNNIINIGNPNYQRRSRFRRRYH